MPPALLLTGNILPFSAQDLESGVTDWANNANSTLSQNATWSHTGNDSLSLTSVAAGTMSAQVNASGWGFAVDPKLLYFASIWVRSATVARTCNVYINWFDATHTFVTNTFSGNFTSSTTVDTLMATGLLTVPSAPTQATFGVLGVQVVGTAAAGEVHSFDTGGIIGPFGNRPQVYNHRLTVPRRRLFVVHAPLPPAMRGMQLVIAAPNKRASLRKSAVVMVRAPLTIPPVTVRGTQTVVNGNRRNLPRKSNSIVVTVGTHAQPTTITLEPMIGHLHHHRTRGMS